MSAFITKLDIVGFGGSVAQWKNKINTIESGSGGANSMSSECFSLGTDPLRHTQTEVAEFLSDRVKLNCDVWEQTGSPDFSSTVKFYLTMTVTAEFSGLFPDSIEFGYTGDSFSGYNINNTIGFSLIAYDSSDSSLGEHIVDYGTLHGNLPPLDIEFALPLVYSEGSGGLHYIRVVDASTSWS